MTTDVVGIRAAVELRAAAALSEIVARVMDGAPVRHRLCSYRAYLARARRAVWPDTVRQLRKCAKRYCKPCGWCAACRREQTQLLNGVNDE